MDYNFDLWAFHTPIPNAQEFLYYTSLTIRHYQSNLLHPPFSKEDKTHTHKTISPNTGWISINSKWLTSSKIVFSFTFKMRKSRILKVNIGESGILT